MALSRKLAYSRFKSIQGNRGGRSLISSRNGLEIFCRTYIYTFNLNLPTLPPKPEKQQPQKTKQKKQDVLSKSLCMIFHIRFK